MAFKNPYTQIVQNYSELVFDLPAKKRDSPISGFSERPEKGLEELNLRISERLSFKKKRILEVGCSTGQLLLKVAKDFPDFGFVGLDWKYKAIAKVAKKSLDQSVHNIFFLRGQAESFLAFLEEASFDEIWVFFPDPWAKKSQLKHRLLQTPFLRDALRVLKPGGGLFFKTDHPGYFQWVLRYFDIPEPDLPAYENTETLEKSKRARQIKVRRLESEGLPNSDSVLKQGFKVNVVSTDFHADLTLKGKYLFSHSLTGFEKLFFKDNLPIYFVELQKIKNPTK